MHAQTCPEASTHGAVQQVSEIFPSVLALGEQMSDWPEYGTECHDAGDSPGDQCENQDLSGRHSFAFVASILALTSLWNCSNKLTQTVAVSFSAPIDTTPSSARV